LVEVVRIEKEDAAMSLEKRGSQRPTQELVWAGVFDMADGRCA
jgi:hypothetical protein